MPVLPASKSSSRRWKKAWLATKRAQTRCDRRKRQHLLIFRSSSGMGGSMRLTENARVRPGGATAVRTDLQRQAAVCTARASTTTTTATATATGSLTSRPRCHSMEPSISRTPPCRPHAGDLAGDAKYSRPGRRHGSICSLLLLLIALPIDREFTWRSDENETEWLK